MWELILHGLLFVIWMTIEGVGLSLETEVPSLEFVGSSLEIAVLSLELTCSQSQA